MRHITTACNGRCSAPPLMPGVRLPIAMSSIQRDEAFAKRYSRLMTRGMLPVAAGFPMMWLDAVRGQVGLGTYFGIASFLIGFFHLFWHERRLKQSYCCPRCNKHLPEWYQKDNQTLAYYCQECGIEWEIPMGRQQQAA